jgi:hypothetical protein
MPSPSDPDPVAEVEIPHDRAPARPGFAFSQVRLHGNGEPLKVRPPGDGASPSGKAAVFGTAIRRFESCRPNQLPRLPLKIKHLAPSLRQRSVGGVQSCCPTSPGHVRASSMGQAAHLVVRHQTWHRPVPSDLPLTTPRGRLSVSPGTSVSEGSGASPDSSTVRWRRRACIRPR